MEEDMKKFRENPNVGEDEEEDEKRKWLNFKYSIYHHIFTSSIITAEDDKDEQVTNDDFKKLKSVSFKKEEIEKPLAEKVEDSEDSDDWGSDSETETSSSDGETQYMSMRERFLKKTTEKEDPYEAEKKKQKKIKSICFILSLKEFLRNYKLTENFALQ